MHSLLDSMGELEGGMIWENGIETCIISYMKWIDNQKFLNYKCGSHKFLLHCTVLGFQIFSHWGIVKKKRNYSWDKLISFLNIFHSLFNKTLNYVWSVCSLSLRKMKLFLVFVRWIVSTLTKYRFAGMHCQVS